MPLCQFEPLAAAGNHRCTNCGTIIAAAKLPIYRECSTAKRAPAHRRPPPIQRGPGTELSRILTDLRITEKEGCGCNERAARMNAFGPAGCRARRHALAGELQDEAASYNLTDALTAGALALYHAKWSLLARNPYLAMIDEAIAAAESNAAARTIKTRHLIYHIWPIASSTMWHWNIEQLLSVVSSPLSVATDNGQRTTDTRLAQFNGRRIIAVATDDLTVPVSEVREAFAGHDVEIIERRNDPRLREAATFVELLSAVQTSDPTHATFYAHAKGSSRRGSVLAPIRAWAARMYAELLDEPQRVTEALRTHAMLGCHFACEPRWQYPGTFWWFHNQTVFATDEWKRLENPVGNEGKGWAVEAFPDRMFSAADCANVEIELAEPTKTGLPFSLYAPDIWGLGEHLTLEDALSRFDEQLYLEAWPDVRAGVERGDWPSGRAHFAARGYEERRPPN